MFPFPVIGSWMGTCRWEKWVLQEATQRPPKRLLLGASAVSWNTCLFWFIEFKYVLTWLLISQSMQQLYMLGSRHQIISWLKNLVRFQFSNGVDWADKNGSCLNSQKWCVSPWGPNQAPTLLDTASARGYCTTRGQIFLVAQLWH